MQHHLDNINLIYIHLSIRPLPIFFDLNKLDAIIDVKF